MNTSNSSGSSSDEAEPDSQKKPNAIEPKIPNFFGKKQKSIEENCCCLYQAAINYLEQVQNPKFKRSYQKYKNRISILLDKNNKESIMITKTDYFNSCLVFLYLNSVNLNFQEKKELLNLLEKAIKTKDLVITKDCKPQSAVEVSSQTSCYMKAKIDRIVEYLIDMFCKEDSAAFAGRSLRILLKTELIKQILNQQFINQLILFGENSIVQISSEALEVFHLIWKLQKPLCQNTVNLFLKENWDFIQRSFDSISDYPNYWANRDSLLTLYGLLSDPGNQNSISTKYINNLQNLQRIMNIMSGGDEQLQTQAILLLSIFIFNKNSIDEESVKKIIMKNKTQLLDCIKETDMEYDKEFDFDQDLMIHQIGQFI